jgi:tetratricopeptide (TPR) repeat protein/DNA-binding XRE family transcriptional regulator
MSAATHRHADFGDRVRRRRRALEWTQAQLAERVACSEDMVRKIESGLRRPSRWLAERLDRHLQLGDGAKSAAAAGSSHGNSASATFAAPSTPSASAPVSASTAPPQSAAPAPLVGRNAEMAQLRRAIDATRAGQGALVLIEGEPGIGKSHLARAALAEFEQTGLSRRSAVVACYEIDATIPLQPLLDWLQRLLDLHGPEFIDGLSAATQAELAELSPQVRELKPGLPAPPPEPELRRTRIFSAFGELVSSRLRDGPLMIVIDDIHWADEMTLALLHRLVRQMAERPLLVVCTYRSEELLANAALALFVRSAPAHGAVARLALQRLNEGDVRSWLEGRQAGRPELAARLYRSSEGHPLYLASMLQQLGEAGSGGGDALPAALRDSIRERLQRLPESSRAVLEIAAVLGRRFDVFTLERGCGMTGDALADAVDLLLQRRLLRPFDDGASLDFDHHCIREVVTDDLGAARRVVLHRRAAEALAGADGDNSAAIAHHHERAGDWREAIAQHTLAAQRSLSMSALREAAAAADRAIELAAVHPTAANAAERQRLHEIRGDVHVQDGTPGLAVADFAAALALARTVKDAEASCDLLAKLGMAHRRADDYAAARAVLGESLAAARALQEPQRIADALYHLGTVAWSDGDNMLALRCHGEAVTLCEQHGLQGLVAVQAWHGDGESHMADCQPQRATESFERSLALARALGDRGYEAENLMMIGYCHSGAFGTADYRRALQCAEEGLAVAEAAWQVWHLGPLHLLQADVWRCQGRVRDAQTLLEAEWQRSQTLKQPRFGIMTLDMLGRLFDEEGRHADAESCWQRALAASEEHRVHFWREQLMAGCAAARLHQGLAVDWPALHEASEAALARRDCYVQARCLVVLAEGALAEGDAGRARDYASRLLALAEPSRMRELEARARWALGRALRDQAPEQARAELDAALALAEQIERPWLIVQLRAIRPAVCAQQPPAAAGEPDMRPLQRRSARRT